MRKNLILLVLCTGIFGTVILLGPIPAKRHHEYTTTVPKVQAAPVGAVQAVELPPIFEHTPDFQPWDSTKRTLIDCDKERQSDRIALACNIYHEARSQSDEGQIAVALVTRNRVESPKYPSTYSEVVWQIKRSPRTNRRVAQFSWALDGKPDKVRDSRAWIKAWNIAGEVISYNIDDFTNGALWYHTKTVNPVWNKSMAIATVIDDHIFYVKN